MNESAVLADLSQDRALLFYRGRVALYAILKALGIGAGDQVACQGFTCLAVPEGILHAGAEPLYIDAESTTLTLDPADLERKVTPRTRAIIVQHTFGIPARMDTLCDFARQRGLVIIEDSCHALGTFFKGKELGTFGDASFYSFEWGKPIPIGLGGAAIVRDPQKRARLAELASHLDTPPGKERLKLDLQYLAFQYGLSQSTYWIARDLYHWLSKKGLIVGTFREAELTGADNPDFRRTMFPAHRKRLARMIAKAPESIEYRRKLGRHFLEKLDEMGYRPPVRRENSDLALLRVPLRFKNKAEILRLARQARVELSSMYDSPVAPLREGELKIARYALQSCPIAERLAREVVSIPVNDRVSLADANRILAFLSKHVGSQAS